MKIEPNALKTSLNNKDFPVFIIYGKEPLIIEETVDNLRLILKEKGFNERVTYFLDESQPNWDALLMSARNRSLIPSKKIIELRLPTNGFQRQVPAKLIEYAQNKRQNYTTSFFIIAGDIGQKMKQKSYQALSKDSAIIEIRQVPIMGFPRWIEQRMRRYDIQPTTEIVQLISSYTEGNLLAAAQVVDMLKLQTNFKTINIETVKKIIFDNTQYNVFQIFDYALAKKISQAVKVLSRLEKLSVEPVLIIWALLREARIMYQLSFSIRKGQSISSIMRTFNVWSSREELINKALRSFPVSHWQNILELLSLADLAAKGQRATTHANIWEDLIVILTEIAGIKTAPTLK